MLPEFPLPYRVLLLLNVGVIYWALLTLICTRYYDLNVVRILGLKDYTPGSLVARASQFARRLVLISLVSWLIYVLLLRLVGYSILLEIVPCVTFVFEMYLLLNRGQHRLGHTLKRVLKGKIDHQRLRINDILLADSMTSYLKIILDLANYVNYVALYTPSGPVSKLDLFYGADLTILAAPQCIRLSQCWREYIHSSKKNKQPLYNFFKYLTNVLPLVMIFVTRSYLRAEKQPASGVLLTEKILILLNSIYTFYWDVFVDWSYSVVSVVSSGKQGLFLKLSIFIDFSLRFLWLWKFIFSKTGFYYFHDSEESLVLFWMQFLEVSRRFLWAIHRLNSEGVNKVMVDIEMK